MKHKQILTSAFTIMLVLSLVMFMANQPPASAHAIFLGKKGKNLEIELSPQQRLFHPHEDGYFYPGSQKITKNLEVINVGDVPFRICRFNATFYGDTYLATGLQIEIIELGTGRGEKPNLLYNETLSNLSEGVEVNGNKAIPQGKSTTLQITVWMPETAGNEYQGLTMTADIAITVCFPPAHARSIKEEALSELEAAKLLTADKHTLKEIDKAIEHIQKSLDPDLWVDDSRLDPKHGDKVFDEEKKSVKHLMKILEDKKEAQAVKDQVLKVIDKLMKADELLADTSIEDAKALGSTDPKVIHEIEKAEKELAKAKEKIVKEHYDCAVDHFKKAWKHAQHAIKKAGQAHT